MGCFEGAGCASPETTWRSKGQSDGYSLWSSQGSTNSLVQPGCTEPHCPKHPCDDDGDARPCRSPQGCTWNPSCFAARRMRSSRVRSSTPGTAERTANAEAK